MHSERVKKSIAGKYLAVKRDQSQERELSADMMAFAMAGGIIDPVMGLQPGQNGTASNHVPYFGFTPGVKQL